MFLCTVHSQIETSRLNNILSTDFIPFQISSIFLSCDTDVVTINNQFVLCCINLDCSVELSVHCIILQHVSHVLYREKVINTYYYNVVLVSLFKSRTENETADTTETVNTNFNHFTYVLLLKGLFVYPLF